MASSKIKIAILDDYAGIALSKFQRLTSTHPNVEIHNFPNTINTKTPEGVSSLASKLSDFTIVSTMRERTPFPRELLEKLPKLKLLMTTSARNASIDSDYLREKGIAYTGTPGIKTGVDPRYQSTNEQCWALILGLCKHVSSADYAVKNSVGDGWQEGQVVRGLAGKTLGLLGLGKLGAAAAVTGSLGFGMKVEAWSSSLTQEKADQEAAKVGLPKGSWKVVGSKKELCENADVLSVHYVLSERSRGIVGKEELAVMKPSAFVVNTSRGPLIDEEALLETIRAGKIGGVGLDVYALEPLAKDSPWRNPKWGQDGKSSKVLLSPHFGYCEERVINYWYDKQVENVDRFLKGEELETKIQ